jgi:hypothetical protein
VAFSLRKSHIEHSWQEHVYSGFALIAHYNDSESPVGRDRTAQVMGAFLKLRVRIQGFIIFDDYGTYFGDFQKQMPEWFTAGKIKYREDVVEELERAPNAFIGLLQGKNFGKLVVHVGAVTK